MADDVQRTIRHGTIGELAPELVPRGIDTSGRCAVVRDGDMVALVPYSGEVSDMLTPDGLDKVINGLADAEFATFGF